MNTYLYMFIRGDETASEHFGQRRPRPSDTHIQATPAARANAVAPQIRTLASMTKQGVERLAPAPRAPRDPRRTRRAILDAAQRRREPKSQPARGGKFTPPHEAIDEFVRWWAGQDSNLQPDRYERPALTIELPAR
jgi:hypothetical protein